LLLILIMDKKLIGPAAIIAAAIVIAIFIFAFSPLQKGILVENVLIDSEGKDPYGLFEGLSKSESFIVSPQMNETSENVDHLMFNGTALFLQVLEANKKNSILVLRVYSNGELSYCLTNYGDVTMSEELSSEECLEFLSPENGAVILIEFPDNSLPQPVVEISESKLVVRPKTDGDVGNACFTPLKMMFKNSEEIVNRANDILSGLSG